MINYSVTLIYGRKKYVFPIKASSRNMAMCKATFHLICNDKSDYREIIRDDLMGLVSLPEGEVVLELFHFGVQIARVQ